MKLRNLEKHFKCVGENFKEGIEIGYCGDIKTLKEWIDIFFEVEKRPEIYKYCNDFIMESIYFKYGKTLKVTKE